MSMREMLRENVTELLNGAVDFSVSLSGGTDSLCMLFVILELGYRPKLYTYYVDGWPSEDRRVSEFVSEEFGLDLELCLIPTDLDTLMSDTRRVVDYGVTRKTWVQTLHGHLYVAAKANESVILNGCGVDGMYGVYPYFFYGNLHKDRERFDELRRREHGAFNPNDDGRLSFEAIYRDSGILVMFPYHFQNITDYLMQFSWEEMNKPVYKWITVKEFDEFKQYPQIYRRRGSQQVVAGTRKLHQQLLSSPLNTRGLKSVGAIYRDIAKGVV